MSVMFEIYYKPPTNPQREKSLAERVQSLGGRLSFREEAGANELSGICLTFEFEDRQLADKAASSLRLQGEFIEGPVDY